MGAEHNRYIDRSEDNLQKDQRHDQHAQGARRPAIALGECSRFAANLAEVGIDRDAERVDEAEGDAEAGVEGEVVEPERLDAEHRADDQVVDIGLQRGHGFDADDGAAEAGDVAPASERPAAGGTPSVTTAQANHP